MARILVVDDDALVLKGTLRVLQRAGHEVWESRNPKTALRMLEHVEVDVVITDVYMPGMNGVELVRRLGQQDRRKHTIVMTGGGVLQTAKELLTEARIAGAERTIEKPFMPAELIAAVDGVMQAGAVAAA